MLKTIRNTFLLLLIIPLLSGCSSDWMDRYEPGNGNGNYAPYQDWCDEHRTYEKIVQVGPFDQYTIACKHDQSLLSVAYFYLLLLQLSVSGIFIILSKLNGQEEAPDDDPRLYGYIKRRRKNSLGAEVLFQLYRIWTWISWFWILGIAAGLIGAGSGAIENKKEEKEEEERKEMIKQWFDNKRK